MNILYVEFNFYGHRLKYISAFKRLEGEKYRLYYLVPQKVEAFPADRQIVLTSGFNEKRTLKTYRAFVNEVKRAVKEFDIDVVHILDGDFLYRYFGIGLKGIKARLVVTYHHMDFGFLKKISIRRIFRASYAGIVHTAAIKAELNLIGVKNAKYIDYPMLDIISPKTSEEARRFFNITEPFPVLAAVGNLVEYKGFDLLIQALNSAKYPCVLLAAGEPLCYDDEYIKKNLINKLVIVKTRLKHLTEEEFSAAIRASDVVMIPYRRAFEGASGPLVSAAVHGKVVIGADHGSIGNIIKTHSLGLTFESENVSSLAETINTYLSKPFGAGAKTKKFAERSSAERFIRKNAAVYSGEE